MNKINPIPEIKIVYHYGHYSFYLHCPGCYEDFENHCDYFPKELCCPYCKYSLELKLPLTIHPLTA